MACLRFLNFLTNLRTGALSTETSGEISTGVAWPIGQRFCLPSREFPNGGHTTMWSTALWGQARFGSRENVWPRHQPQEPRHGSWSSSFSRPQASSQTANVPQAQCENPHPTSALCLHTLPWLRWLVWSWGLGRCNLQIRGLRRNRDPRREETLPKISPDEGAPMTRDP